MEGVLGRVRGVWGRVLGVGGRVGGSDPAHSAGSAAACKQRSLDIVRMAEHSRTK